MKEALYVGVYVPKFPAQALLRLRPWLTQLPVVVLAGDPPLEQVCSLNSHADELGAERGMSRSELESFSDLRIIRRSEEEERITREVLLNTAWTHTPRVEIQFSALSEFVMVLDMAGTQLIHGSALQMAQKVLWSLQALNLNVQIAVCANPAAAICLASSTGRSLTIVLPGEEKDCLSGLDLSTLNLTTQQAETFADWGLHTLGDIAAIPETDLIVRLGQAGKRLRQLACGELQNLMVTEEPVFSLEEFIAFDEPVELSDSLLFVLSPVLDQLLARAQARSFALAAVIVKLELDGGTEHVYTIKPSLPVSQREILLKLFHLDLRAHPPSAGVKSLFVCAEPGSLSKVQLGLFSPQIPEPLNLDVTLARIAALVGEDRVGRVHLLNSHHSDRFRVEKFSVQSKIIETATLPKAAAALRRLRPPVLLRIRWKLHRISEFFFQDKWFVIKEACGPWRKSGEWWSSSVWSREEWDIHACANSGDTLLCVLTKDLLRKEWHLEALYD